MSDGFPLEKSSRDIAGLVKSKHGDVKRSALRLAARGVISEPLICTSYIHPQNGQEYQEYWFNRRDSLALIAQLSPQLVAAYLREGRESNVRTQRSTDTDDNGYCSLTVIE